MTFEEVVDQAIDIVRRRGQVSYRMLKRQFGLDDDYLDDLKYELIEIQQLVVDQDGKMLVWLGAADTTPSPTFSQPALQEPQPSQTEPPPLELSTPDAERRQLTVMFCDLTDSTKLAGQLDPEDLRDVIRAYQATSAEVIERYDGYVAQHLGDGLMVYFGWPKAHEDDAQRAVHTGLGIVEAVGELNARLEQEKEIRLAVRIGIHTGLVVMGEIGKGASQEHLALGETPNIASRIEGIAEPDTVAISDATYQLVQGYFVCKDLGRHNLKGVNEPQQAYRVVGASGAQSRLDIGVARGLTPLVGRESEVTLLLERWQQVKDGQGQEVLLSGEAGIGKSRLVQVLKEHAAGDAYTLLECRSSPYYQNTALYPITDMLQRMLQWQQDDTPEAKLDKLERIMNQYRIELEETAPLFATLLSLPIPDDRYPPIMVSPQRQRQKTLETIVAILLKMSEQQPVLFILEDLHWTDPSTLELMEFLIDQTPTAAICVLLTCRPAFQPPWSSRSYLTQMTLNRLSLSQVEQMAERVAGGKRLPDEVLQQIVEKTDGVPLYVEEMTKAVLESATLQEVDGHYELVGSLSSIAIPATLQDSLMARLDRLVTSKAVAQYAAVMGRQFSFDLLQSVLQLNETMLQHELGRLVEAEIVYQRGIPPQATYTFKHALIQDAAYQSLLKSTRQQYHQRIAQVLEEQFPETVEAQPELMAHHYMEAGLTESALDYWQQAGEKAFHQSAYSESVRPLTAGIELIQEMPEAPVRMRRELDMQLLLARALLIVRGIGAKEALHIYTRAKALCEDLDDTQQLFNALTGLAYSYQHQGEMQKRRELDEQLLTLAQRNHDLMHFAQAHQGLGTTLFHLGDLATAHSHLDQAIKLYDAYNYRLPGLVVEGVTPIGCLYYDSIVLWLLGYPDVILAHIEKMRIWAQALATPHSHGSALWHAARLHFYRRELHAAREQIDMLMPLATQEGLLNSTRIGTIMRGYILASQGKGKKGIALLRQGLASQGGIARATWLALLAEAYGYVGQPEEGLRVLTESLEWVENTEVRNYEAELYRLKGTLLVALSPDNNIEAEACFHHALDIARNQRARSWELRAATSLARLWQQQGKRQEARDLLASVYGWFTEGFDTADLQEAKGLLDMLCK